MVRFRNNYSIIFSYIRPRLCRFIDRLHMSTVISTAGTLVYFCEFIDKTIGLLWFIFQKILNSDKREYRATMGRALIGCCHWATANQSSPHRGPSSFVGDLNFLNALHELHFCLFFVTELQLKYFK